MMLQPICNPSGCCSNPGYHMGRATVSAIYSLVTLASSRQYSSRAGLEDAVVFDRGSRLTRACSRRAEEVWLEFLAPGCLPAPGASAEDGRGGICGSRTRTHAAAPEGR
jgi:hypothetical protein